MIQDSSDSVSLFQVLENNVQRNPTKNALNRYGREFLTYEQLRRRVGLIGRTLQSTGIKKTDRVAVILLNGPEMAVTFLGIACHAICAPLNPAFRQEEIEYYLVDLKAEALVVSNKTDLPVEVIAKKLGINLIYSENLVGDSINIGGDGEKNWISTRGGGDDIALVLHTSGTTSRPKQVPLSHKNLCASAKNIAEVLALTPDDRCLNVMPLFHIHGLVGVLLATIHSGGSVLCSNGFDARNFARLMQKFQPTWYSAVPTIHQAILALAEKNPAVTSGNKLRFIRSSSSALPPTVMVALEETFEVPVIESYGMTEAAHQMASNPLPPAVRKPGSVGLPAGPEMGVIDEQGNLLGAMETGEIVIQGENVTQGYVNNIEANEEAFADGWFRTGDLGSKDKDGYFYINGRTKEMINRGGEKISPREIDEALLGHPAVTQAIAFAVPHPTLGEDLVAAVVVTSENAVSEALLREHAFNRLAPFKVPSRIILVDSIPKGPTGKVRRIGLHKILENVLRAQYVAPRTGLERSVVAAFEKVLAVPNVGVLNNFFALGGDSIKATRAIALLCSEYQTDLPAHSLFLNPTAEELSLEISRRMAQDTENLASLLDEIEAMSEDEAASSSPTDKPTEIDP